MIEKIQGQVRFAISDATISVLFQPQPGITAVVGPNGVGKTFTAIESLRYLLFGSKALRSTLSSIKELELSGVVQIHGQSYHIQRGLKAAKIEDAHGDVFAVGQEEVTNKVTELLGYGLEVFDLCNASVQGETQNLGALTPGKRKEKIDEVLRVTNVRAIEKACRDEANGLKREAAALTKSLPILGPVPKEPDGYVPSDALADRLEAARQQRQLIDNLSEQLIPVAVPQKPALDRPAADALAIAEKREALQAVVDAGRLEPMTEEAINAAVARRGWEMERDSRGPEPTLSLKVIEDQLSVWGEIEAIERMVDVEAQCPKCDHQFRTRPPEPATPETSKRELQVQQRRHENWQDPLPFEPTAEHGSLSPSEAAAERASLERWIRARDAEKALKVLPSSSQGVSETHQLLADWRAYDAAVERNREAEQNNAMIQLQLDDMAEPEDVTELAQKMADVRNYDHALGIWNRDKKRYDDLQADITEKMKTAEDFLEGNKELSEARAELKSFLAPALSREASELLHDMTNGVLKALIVDEEMDITVDGQPLETLSGAGKTVANIALRISLTKVLTGSAFPVFIGDEMDGDLDATRREATTQAMVSLKDHLKQIILITHKDVDIADHVITLGEPT